MWHLESWKNWFKFNIGGNLTETKWQVVTYSPHSRSFVDMSVITDNLNILYLCDRYQNNALCNLLACTKLAYTII